MIGREEVDAIRAELKEEIVSMWGGIAEDHMHMEGLDPDEIMEWAIEQCLMYEAATNEPMIAHAAMVIGIQVGYRLGQTTNA